MSCVLAGGLYTYFFMWLTVALWVKASNVTAACERTRLRALEAVSAAASWPAETGGDKGSLADSDAEVERANRFVRYTELKSPGFSCHGVTISYHLGMLLSYPLLTAIFTLALPLATSFLVPP